MKVNNNSAFHRLGRGEISLADFRAMRDGEKSMAAVSSAATDTIVRIFCPDVPSWNPALVGYDRLPPDAIQPSPMCEGQQGLTVSAMGRTLARGEDNQVAVYPVHAGDELRTIRPGHREHRQTIKQDGVVLDVRLTGENATLARRYAAMRGMGASLGISHLGGGWHRQRVPGVDGPRDVFGVSHAELRTVELTAGEDRDAGTTVSIID